MKVIKLPFAYVSAPYLKRTTAVPAITLQTIEDRLYFCIQLQGARYTYSFEKRLKRQ